ncbi:hypothetical protein [Candidatus Tisiphia endosymbiont of Nemotelus uliginosus]|uniref:hypothetical protein n=1 Tax=Candidatus Tisiphia endosymbiont of Nemotelus uliginosus TaxID=3077926 RepID=UPI0035C9018B
MSERNNEIFNDKSLEDLKIRVAKLTERSEKDLQNEMNNFNQIHEQFNTRLGNLSGQDSYFNDEVDKLLVQIQSEVNLEAKRSSTT